MNHPDGYYWARFSADPFIIEKVGDTWHTMGSEDGYTTFPRRPDFVPEGLVILAGPLPAPSSGAEARPIAAIVRALVTEIEAIDRLEGGAMCRPIVEEAKAWLGEAEART